MEEKNKKTFKELWADTRMRALIKLGMWFAFFLLIFLILSITALFNKNPDNNIKEEIKQEEVVSANIPSMLENLISSNYTYEYKINMDNTNYSYTGSKENEEIKGYYESNNGIIKYMVKENNYYELNNEELKENNSIISEQDKYILDLNNLLSLIKEYELTNEVLKENDSYNYSILKDNNSYQINIETKLNDISNININYNNVIYNLTFKNIESIKE